MVRQEISYKINENIEKENVIANDKILKKQHDDEGWAKGSISGLKTAVEGNMRYIRQA